MNASDEKQRKSDTGYTAVAVGVLIVILFIGAGWYFSGQPEPAQQSPMQQAAKQDGASGATTAEKNRPSSNQQQQAALQPGDSEMNKDEAGAAGNPGEAGKSGDTDQSGNADKSDEAGEADEETTAAAVVPTFDTIRIEPNGDTVVAGQAAPGSNVTLFSNSEEVAEAVADAGGNWAMVLDKPLATGNSDLWISAEKGGAALRSEQQLAVVIDPEGKSTPLVVVQDDAGSRVMQESQQVASAETGASPSQGTAVDGSTSGSMQMASKEPGFTAPEKPMADKPVAGATAENKLSSETPAGASGGQMAAGTQQPAETPATGGTAGQQMAARTSKPNTTMSDASAAPARIEAADYDDRGNLYISGMAAPGATVRLYYDNELLGDATAGDNGRWSLTTQRPLDGKVHALRVDQLEPGSGNVAARSEVSLIAQIPGEPAPAQGGEQKVAAAGGNPGGSGATAGTENSGGQAPSPGAASSATAPSGEASSGASASAGSGEKMSPDMAERKTAAAEAPRQAASEPPQPRVFTVKRGDNLWRIARGYYGRGIRYTMIFEANKDQIRDPDLIYPDQVFLIPRRVEGETASN